jgi:hypothetical protein
MIVKTLQFRTARRLCRQHYVYVCKIAFIFALASGLAAGFGATIDRLTSPPTIAVAPVQPPDLPEFARHVADRRVESSDDTAQDILQFLGT